MGGPAPGVRRGDVPEGVPPSGPEKDGVVGTVSDDHPGSKRAIIEVLPEARLKPVAKLRLFFEASGFEGALFVERGKVPQLCLELVPGLYAATHLALRGFRHIIAGGFSTLPAVADV
jgi:hypothetical protein